MVPDVFQLTCGSATASEFEVEPVQGRKVSKVVKTTVVKGERMERRRGDPLLSADLPSAREDFEKVSGISLCWSTNRRLCCLNVIIRLS